LETTRSADAIDAFRIAAGVLIDEVKTQMMTNAAGINRLKDEGRRSVGEKEFIVMNPFDQSHDGANITSEV
jgi:hypothetical protein